MGLRAKAHGRSGNDPLKATKGMLASMLSLVLDAKEQVLALAFDNPILSFRNDLVAG